MMSFIVALQTVFIEIAPPKIIHAQILTFKALLVSFKH